MAKNKRQQRINAPIENAKNEEMAAPHGDMSSSGLMPNSSRANVSNALSGSDD